MNVDVFRRPVRRREIAPDRLAAPGLNCPSDPVEQVEFELFQMARNEQADRTVIGGQSAPYDFAAQFQQDSVGRIMKRLHGSESGNWFWSCYEGGANGKVPTKDEAVVGVERAYTRRVVKADWRAM
ncbi:MAG: hypothetical protein EOQ42_30745 [Mesorhizobium sp.]|nr:MAG: hypothetical protein EOQ43_27990 [Mesorhizobium sp.]RWB38207.1 MAG: hypothetical protein EOQ42_30745 [Mesorhizobium sp.]RWD45932.1 MAG: hypothetical protein EOS35_11155 [Mesorhizobium sp.]